MRLFCWIFLIFVHLTIDNAFGFEDENSCPTTPTRPSCPFPCDLSPIPLAAHAMNRSDSGLTNGGCAGAGAGAASGFVGFGDCPGIGRITRQKSASSVVSAGRVYSVPRIHFGGSVDDTQDDSLVLKWPETTASCPTSPHPKLPQPAGVLRRARSAGDTPTPSFPALNHSRPDAALLWNAGLVLLGPESFNLDDSDDTTSAQRHLALDCTGDAEGAPCDDSFEGRTGLTLSLTSPVAKSVTLEWLDIYRTVRIEETCMRLTPTDRLQIDGVPTEFDKDSLGPYSPEKGQFSPPPSVLGRLSLASPLSQRRFSERFLTETLYTNYPIDRLHWNGIPIGFCFQEIQKRLIFNAVLISQLTCGGLRKSTINVGTFELSGISKTGQWFKIPTAWENAGFLSTQKSSMGKSSAFEVDSPVFLSGPSLDTVPKEPQNTLSKMTRMRMDGLTYGTIEKGYPVFFSDSDVVEKNFIRIRNNIFAAQTSIATKFPQSAVTLLKHQVKTTLKAAHPTCSLHAKRKIKRSVEKAGRKSQRLGNLAPLISMLSETDISKMHGHSEQFMVRFFHEYIIPEIDRYHTLRKRGSSREGLQEVFLHMASLQDCCTVCSRLVSSISGPYILSDGTEINVRVIMTTGKDYPVFKIKEGVIINESPRKDMYLPLSMNLTDLPGTIFNFV